MKKFNPVGIRTLFSANLIILIIILAGELFAQESEPSPSNQVNIPTQYYDWESMPGKIFGDLKWYEVIELAISTYEDVRKAFYREWDGKSYLKGQMYKQFKRYELMTLGAISGNQKSLSLGEMYVQKISQSKRSTSAGNWISKGPNGPLNPNTWNNQGVGRIDEIAFHPTNENIIYVGAPSGGLWKSTNGGTSWTSLGDDFVNLGISGIEIDPANPDHIYVSTGSRDSYETAFYAILKSTNGGSTWTTLSGSPSNVFHVFKFLVDPTNAAKMYLATNDGVHYSTDGGLSWNQSTGMSGSVRDLEFKPGATALLYASIFGEWYQSNDSGTSFTKKNSTPFSASTAATIALGVTPDNTDAVFLYAYDFSTSAFKLYKYLNSTNTYSIIADLTKPATNPDGSTTSLANYFWGQYTYDWSMAINPTNEDEIYIGSISLFRTTDGGNNWVYMSGSGAGGGSVHVDMHTVEYNSVSNTALVGCDGGIYKFNGLGNTWLRLNNMTISQVYSLGISELNKDLIICGNQDNGVFQNDGSQWNYRIIGDGADGLIDPVDNLVQFGCIGPNGGIYKSTDGVSFQNVFSSAISAEVALWSFPLKRHPVLRHVLYTGHKNVWRSVDAGETWTKISNINGDIQDIEIAESDPNIIYVLGAFQEDGIYRSADGGMTWQPISWPYLQDYYQRDLEVDPKNPNTLYTGNYGGQIRKSIDGGLSWFDYQLGMPNVLVYSIVCTAGVTENLYAGTSAGVYFKDGSANWTPYNDGLPNVIVNELEINEKDGTLTAATYGRGIWETPLQNVSNVCYYAAPSPTASGNLNLCDQSHVILDAGNSPSGAYQWYKEDIKLPGEIHQLLVVTDDGTYSAVFPGTCKGFSSTPFLIRDQCVYTQCNPFNPLTYLGTGNTTIVNLSVPLNDIVNAQNPTICLYAIGDVGQAASQENFNVTDEDGSFVIQTPNSPSDCATTPKYCYSVNSSILQNWLSNNNITYTFDPISANINNFLCDQNEACVELTFELPPDCMTNLSVVNPIANGLHQAEVSLNSAGSITANQNVVFQAGQQVELLPNFQVDGVFVMKISGCK